MVWLQEVARPQTWTDQAIRDTIATIVKAPEFRRDVGQSLLDRGARWFLQQVNRFFSYLSDTEYGRVIAVALVILAIALIVARIAIGLQAEQSVRKSQRNRSATQTGAAQLLDAERLAATGDYTAAAHALFSSLLVAGATRGEFRVHPSKTTGDYVAELRRKRGAWLQPFQSFRSRYDRVIYGDMQCSAEDYQALAGDVRQMVMR